MMTNSPKIPDPELIHALRKALAGEVRVDVTTRILYSTDASIYQIEPLGVIIPRTKDDLAASVETCAAFGAPVLARGAGSSLGGQAIGPAMILDCSRYLNHIVEIDPAANTALVEPGVVLAALNRDAAKHGLQFGPDPASAERATIGGSLSNNSAGAHSILYGMSVDALISAEVVLSDGSLANFGEVTLDEARRRATSGEKGWMGKEQGRIAGTPIWERESGSRESAFYQAALDIREKYAGAIKEHWPRTWRRVSGYNLDRLIPWSPSQPPMWEDGPNNGLLIVERPYPPIAPNHLNLSSLVAGAEGTLAVIRQAEIRLMPAPRQTILAVLAFRDMVEACEQAPAILENSPTAVELIPHSIIELARSVPAYALQLSVLDQLRLIDGKFPTLLVVEFANFQLEDQSEQLRKKAKALESFAPVYLADTPDAQRQVWGVRKVGLGILMARAGDIKPWPSIEDLSVPVERLGEFARGIERLLKEQDLDGEVYGHASAGCLHIRPLVNLKTVQGVHQLREIATQAVELTLQLGGSVSGEHGDGLARSEWYEKMFGKEVLAAFRELKRAADPQGLLNPGKMVSLDEDQALPAMDQNLRLGPEYRATGWPTVFDFSTQAGVTGAIEQCNGAGVCRKTDGVMCPSFQATQEEMHSTRGRANLLRAMISGKFSSNKMGEEAGREALDLCLACKGCKAECPSAVDMAKLKYEFMNMYYKGRKRKLRDYMFGYIGTLASLGHPFATLVNPALRNPSLAGLSERFLGLARQRPFPLLSQRSLRAMLRTTPIPVIHTTPEAVLFLSDAFTEYFFPEIGLAAIRLLSLAGCQVHILPVIGAGRTLISKGFLAAARRHARQLVDAILAQDPEGRLPIVGVEPSEIYTLIDEYPDLLNGDDGVKDDRVKELAERAFTIEEILVRPAEIRPSEASGQTPLNEILRIATILQLTQHPNIPFPKKVVLHGHCYQKARKPASDGYPVGVEASASVLRQAGFEVDIIEDGCCGMAGAFGYEAEHYDLSIKVGELALLPAVRKASKEDILVASGVSCRSQITDATGRSAIHPAVLLDRFVTR